MASSPSHEIAPRQLGCRDGRHCAGPVVVIDGVRRSRCRNCGCALFRKDGFRRWVFSGRMG